MNYDQWYDSPATSNHAYQYTHTRHTQYHPIMNCMLRYGIPTYYFNTIHQRQ